MASIVKGSVAEEEEVEKAVSNGIDIDFKCNKGFIFAKKFKIKGRTIIEWTIRAASTVIMYSPNRLEIPINAAESPD